MNKSNVGLCLIARIASTRLPNKVLKLIKGKKLIEYIINNLKESKYSNIVLCTTELDEDDELEKVALDNGIKCIRGSVLAVSDRILKAANKYNFTDVVRITGDNIFTDYQLMDYLIDQHIQNKADYSRINKLPNGITTEIIKVNALEKCYEVHDKNKSEYMTIHLFDPELFKTLVIEPPNQLIGENINLSVDNEIDFERSKRIVNEVNPLTLQNILEYIRKVEMEDAYIHESTTVKLINEQMTFFDYKKYLNDLARKSILIKM